VLARFNGEDSPVGLIAAAEKSGQIAHLDYIMVSAAAAQLEANPDPNIASPSTFPVSPCNAWK
jgi:EAL domain-containing protein (putative c-di-GMP-specific phosphodiesterase class I)